MNFPDPIPLFVVDAFAEARFQGNPAAVCPLPVWLPDDVLQNMAVEHNLSETAFLVPESGGYHLRWFTPVAEVKLCGHATLASAFVAFERLGFPGTRVEFRTLSGSLAVERRDGGYEMDFPAQPPVPCPLPPDCVLTPYWAPRLGKMEMRARQISARGGSLQVRLARPRVFIAGKALLYSEGRIHPF